MNQNEIDKLQEDLKTSAETLEKSLKDNHLNIEANFYNNRYSTIKNLKSYLVNISIISATIIPFSSLVFQIPREVIIVNVNLWILSLLAFIVSLGLFIYCFLKLIESERKSYVKLLLGYLGSGNIDFVSLRERGIDDRILELIEVLKSQDKFSMDLKNTFDEKAVIDLIRYIKFSSWLFIGGLGLFFLSIVSSKILAFICL